MDRVRDRDMGSVRDRVRLRGLAIAAPSYSGPLVTKVTKKSTHSRFLADRTARLESIVSPSDKPVPHW